jgi:hypothetical protein
MAEQNVSVEAVTRLTKSWKYELDTRLATMQGFVEGVRKEVGCAIDPT